MANLSSFARPYALAAFQYASDKNELSAWSAFLNLAATIVQQPIVASLLNNPEISKTKLLAVFQGILASLINDAQKNFFGFFKNGC